MAHLIKLEDYASRYEHDIQRYPSQFTRLKKDRWLRMKREWMRVNKPSQMEKDDTLENWFDEPESGFFSSALAQLKKLSWRRRREEREEIEEEDNRTILYKETSLEDLKRIFYEDIFQAQLRWASASLLEESRMDTRYKYDQRLLYLLRELPDNYMLLYYPVFVVGKAPVEMEVILLSPTDIYLIAFLDGGPTSVFEATSGRYWREYVNKERKKMISPFISLKRMSGVVRDILKDSSIQMPLNRIVLSRDSIIDDTASSMKVEIIDKRGYDQWIEKRKRHPSPIKKIQLQTADILLRHSLTTSFERRNIEEERAGE